MNREPFVPIAEYPHVTQVLEQCLDLRKKLPQSPFKCDGYNSLCEYEHVCGGLFGPALDALCKLYGDEYIVAATIDPEKEWFQQYYNSSGAFVINADRVATDYPIVIDYKPNGDITGRIQFISMIFAIAGSSGKWSIWGERMLGTAIIRTAGDDQSWRPSEIWFPNVDEALESFVEFYFDKQPIPDELQDAFHREFGNASG